MNRLIIAVAVLVSSACEPGAKDASADTAAAGRAQPAGNDRAAVQAAIDSSLARFRDGLLKADPAMMASIFADDAIVLAPDAPAVRGRADITRMNAGMLAAFTFPDASFRTSDLIVTGDYAIETGKYEMTRQPKRGKAVTNVGKYVSVWKRQADGSWKMIRDIMNSDGPAA